ncbi:MAG: hypothetical protein LQ342_008460, partial [Letrouitia transgressa]
MFMSLVLSFLALLLLRTNGHNIPERYTPPQAHCIDYVVPVTVTSDDYQWVGPRWTDNFGLTEFVTTVVTRPAASFPPPFGNPVASTALYEISATFCTPKKGSPKAKTVLLATHGLAFSRSYWNSPYKPEKYNFVQAATDAGYSVFFYDRLGTGSSTKSVFIAQPIGRSYETSDKLMIYRISGYVNQISIQISILAVLTKNIRAGQFTGETGVPSSVVFVGHSFGSFISNALVAAQPSIADGIVMTGYSLNGNNTQIILEASRVAAIQNRKKFGEFDPGYVTTADVYSTVSDFFKAPDYERDVAVFAESSKAPYGIAELISISPPFFPPLNASLFGGPAL